MCDEVTEGYESVYETNNIDFTPAEKEDSLQQMSVAAANNIVKYKTNKYTRKHQKVRFSKSMTTSVRLPLSYQFAPSKTCVNYKLGTICSISFAISKRDTYYIIGVQLLSS